MIATLGSASEERADNKIIKLDRHWKTFAILLIFLLTIAFIPSGLSQFAAALAYVIIIGSAIFLPYKYSSFSIVTGILVGTWLTRSLPSQLDVISSRIILETWLALIGLVRAKPWQIQIKDSMTRQLIALIAIMLLVDYISLLRGSRILRDYQVITISITKYTTQIGSYVRFIGIVLLMYKIGFKISERDILPFIIIWCIPLCLIGISIGLSVAKLSPTTSDALMLARISGFTDPNVGTIPTAMATVMFLIIVMDSHVRPLTYIFMVILSIVALICIFLSGSRTALLTLLCGIAAFVVMKHRVNINMLIFIVLLLSIVWISLPTIYKERMIEQNLQEDRLDKFEGTWTFIQDNILWGGGSEVYRLGLDRQGAHNTALHILATGGIVYFIPWGGCLWIMGKMAFKLWKHTRNTQSILFISCIVMYIVASNGVTVQFYGDSTGLYFSSIMALMLGYLSRREPRLFGLSQATWNSGRSSGRSTGRLAPGLHVQQGK
jgi:O-antigen ligase